MLILSKNTVAAPLQWTCDWPEAKSQTFSLYQGETATFEPTFRVNGRTVTNATIEAVWYQTNGMGNAWWKLDGATFAPSNDVGAAAYRFFVEARIPEPFNLSTFQPFNSKLYRANGALRMLPSPGFEPNAIELPVRTLDFAAIDYYNAPWPAEIAAAVAPVAEAAANAASVAANAAASASAANVNIALCATKAELNHHASNQNIHVTAAKQAAWDAKQAALPLETGTGASSLKLKVSGNGATTAKGDRAVAFGYAAKATEANAAAFNNQTTASGQNSAAFGYKTAATNNAEIAVGILNNPHNGTRFSVGMGVNATSTRTNAVEVMANGDVYVLGVGGYTGGERTIPADGVRTLQEEVAAIREDVRDIAAAATAATNYTDSVAGSISNSITRVHSPTGGGWIDGDGVVALACYEYTYGGTTTRMEPVGDNVYLDVSTKSRPKEDWTYLVWDAANGRWLVQDGSTVPGEGVYIGNSKNGEGPAAETIDIYGTIGQLIISLSRGQITDSIALRSEVEAITNYTDSATNSLSASLSSQLSRASQSATNYTDSAVGELESLVDQVDDRVDDLSDEVAPAVAAYPRVYAFMTGSTNANFVVTNYQLTAEADAERTHFDPADPDLDYTTVPSSLRLEDASSGTNRVVVDVRDWTVWYYAQKIGGAINTAFTNAVATCRAWVNFTATGLENPVPDTLIVDVPNIWLMAGKTFEKHVAGSNACWVIRSKDTVMPISDNAQSAGGFLELTDAFGEPYIRFNKTESYFVDPQAEGITNTNGTWYIVYPTQTKPNGGANAAIEGSTTYPGKAVLKAEDDPDCPATITWAGEAGHWVMVAVPKSVGGVVPAAMFFGAVVEVQGQDYIEYLRPMSIPHLLVDGVKIAPEIPASHPAGTTITWKVVE